MASMVEKTTDEEERRTTIMETVQVSFAIFYLWMWQHKKNLNRSRINECNFVPLVCARRFDGILFSLIIAERAFHTLFLTLTEQTIQMIPMSFPSDIVSFSSLFFFFNSFTKFPDESIFIWQTSIQFFLFSFSQNFSFCLRRNTNTLFVTCSFSNFWSIHQWVFDSYGIPKKNRNNSLAPIKWKDETRRNALDKMIGMLNFQYFDVR